MGTGYRSDCGSSKVMFECRHSLPSLPSPGDSSQSPGEPEPVRDGDGPGAAGWPQQRSFHRGPQDTHTPLTWDLVPSLTLLPLLSAFFNSSNFTCKTLQAVTRKHLTYFTAFQSSLIKNNVYPSNLRAPRCPAVASPGPPSHCCAPGSGTGSGTGAT